MRRSLAQRWRAALDGRLGIGQQVFVFYALIVVLVIGSGIAAAVIVGDRLVHRAASEQVASVANTVAAMPAVADALRGDDPAAELQPLARQIEDDADMLFVVIADPDGIRHSHPLPDAVGEPMVSSLDQARQHEVVVDEADGRMGRSLHAIAPILDNDDELLGVVVTGVQIDRKRDALTGAYPLLFGAAAFSLTVAAAGSWWISRRLARQTFGLREAELAQVYAHHHAVLHAIREGLVVIDTDGNVALMNDAAQELLGVGPHSVGQSAERLPIAQDTARKLATNDTLEDTVTLAGERLVVLSQVPVQGPHGHLGSALILRDHSEIMALADELSTTRSLADGLRAQVHESANRLHTIVMLVELGDTHAAVELATAQVRAKKKLTNRLTNQLGEPTLVALLLGKHAEAERRSVALTVTDDSSLTGESHEPIDLVTIVGNLLDNAMDAAVAGSRPPRVQVAVREDETGLVIRVRDTGDGFSQEALEHAFDPGWSSKPVDPDRRHGRGIGMALIRQVVTRRGGTITIANATAETDRPSPTGTERTRPVQNEDPALAGAIVTVRLPYTHGESY